MHRKAFTLIELLVVISIIAALAAVVFPVFAKVREKARQIGCASHQRQLGMALLQYVQDYDETFPWAFSHHDRSFWLSKIDPYVKSGSNSDTVSLTCPDAGTAQQSYSTNGQVVGLLGDPATGGHHFYPSVVTLARVNTPADIILLGDAILCTASDTGRIAHYRSSDEYAYPHPATIADHTNDTANGRDWMKGWNGIPLYNNKQIAWRHAQGANFTYVDGHTKWARRGILKDENWDVRCAPGVGCDNVNDPSYYPARDPNCDNQSALNCQ
jgi:prepilin-type N-terminal cleavage/methylation domain-containing protein/prepilin-type processing-associated H-X9-DG protein